MDATFFEEANYVVVKPTGVKTYQQFRDGLNQVIESPQYRKGMGRIWDLREVSLSMLDDKDIAFVDIRVVA